MARTVQRPSSGSIAYVVMSVICAVGLLLIVGVGQWRGGSLVVAAGLMFGGVARFLLPDRLSGLLRVRRKRLDVLMLSGAAVVLAVIALSIPLRR